MTSVEECATNPVDVDLFASNSGLHYSLRLDTADALDLPFSAVIIDNVRATSSLQTEVLDQSFLDHPYNK